ncbi:MAG: ATP-binding protein [Paludibacteraceae bacterium]|nr:ATP-binding protein [Paludibacteraceae bacterium]
MIQREITSAIKSLATKYPVIALTGPRQSGKTTLLKQLFPDYEYLSLENPDIREFAETDTKGFLKRYAKYVIFDEAQRVPALFSYIQGKVDESGIMGQFILSGSQNFHLMQNITQSLAGRVAIFRLFPFDLQELRSANLLSENYADNLVKGFYPAIYDRNIPAKTFYSNYVQTYIQRDVSELIAIKDLRLFQNFLSLCATRAGQLLNLNALANECGISQPTAKSWLSALENSYVVFLLYPYHENFSKRIVKTPKLYFYDTGLLCYLLKIANAEQLLLQSIKGALFENMMISEYVKRMYHRNDIQDIWFWRDSAGHEVDLLVGGNLNLDLIEFKATHTIMNDLFKGLTFFEVASEKNNLSKTLVYAGLEYQRRSTVDVMPWIDFGKTTKFDVSITNK